MQFEVKTSQSREVVDVTERIQELVKPGAKAVSVFVAHTSVTVPVKDGQLVLGTWQRIILVELDGPRERNLIVTSL
jgi:thiamine phosphate synthase YjbQ (UPF0047 family)